MRSSNTTPAYRNIAMDIATKIVKGELKINQKISGRSTLAGMYNVSPETIRRAIALLEEMKVVSSNIGSGIEIISIKSAEKFLEKYRDNEYINTVKEDIHKIIKQKRQLDFEMEKNFTKMVDYIERFNSKSPFPLIEIEIFENCTVLGKNVNQVKFWQYTGATIVACRRGKDVIISPGPNYMFKEGDIIVVVGTKDVNSRVKKFLYLTEIE